MLAIGPDRAGNLLEVVVLTLAGGRLLVIQVEERAEAEHTTTSEIIRAALRRFLDVA